LFVSFLSSITVLRVSSTSPSLHYNLHGSFLGHVSVRF
jgi:hypothetical protein